MFVLERSHSGREFVCTVLVQIHYIMHPYLRLPLNKQRMSRSMYLHQGLATHSRRLHNRTRLSNFINFSIFFNFCIFRLTSNIYILSRFVHKSIGNSLLICLSFILFLAGGGTCFYSQQTDILTLYASDK